MFSDWARAVALAHTQRRKQERILGRIAGGNYDRQRKTSGRPKGTPKRPKGASINGYVGGETGTNLGSIDIAQDVSKRP